MPQGSVLLHFVVAVVADVVIEQSQSVLSEMLYADGLISISENIEGLCNKCEKLNEAFESRGSNVDLRKTKVMVSGYK